MSFSSQAGLASLRGLAIQPPVLLWRHEAERLHDQLVERGIIDPETGERFTVVDCDNAIQGAIEAFNAREGARVIDIFDPVWYAIRPSIAAYLGLEYDELDEVAP